jgi:hypothetical protein
LDNPHECVSYDYIFAPYRDTQSRIKKYMYYGLILSPLQLIKRVSR